MTYCESMKKLIAPIVLSISLFFGGIAHAAPVAAFTSSTVAPQVGVALAFNASSAVADDPGTPESEAVAGTNCTTNRCQWAWYYLSGGIYKVGGQIGEGHDVTYTFPASAALKPYVLVQLKVTAPGGTNNFTTVGHAYVVAS